MQKYNRVITDTVIDLHSFTDKRVSTFSERLLYLDTFISVFGKSKYEGLLYLIESIISKSNDYIVYEGEEVIGCFSLSYDYGEIMLSDFGVLKQGEGVGSKVIDMVYKEVLFNKHNNISLYITKEELAPFYEKHGFLRI